MGQTKRTARTLVQKESLSVKQVRMYSECIGGTCLSAVGQI